MLITRKEADTVFVTEPVKLPVKEPVLICVELETIPLGMFVMFGYDICEEAETVPTGKSATTCAELEIIPTAR